MMDLKLSNEFLLQLRENNNRDWFNENRGLYKEAKKEFEEFIEKLFPIVRKIDSEIDIISAKDSVFRIFRDVRFSKNRIPYKTNFGAVMAKGGKKSPYAGFYIHFQPDNSFVGGGAYMPESKYLKAIRIKIFENPQEYKDIIENPGFTKYFKEIYGDKLKTAPRGFSKDFENIELLRNKSYAVIHKVDNSFWSASDLFKELDKIFKAQVGFNKYINGAIFNASMK
jgi:uncharacterized protein (TIGR02453 family)